MFFNVLVAQWASDADLNKGGSPLKVGGLDPWGNLLLDCIGCCHSICLLLLATKSEKILFWN